ncbi:TonB-dependent receptor plug domain-containing protein [Erythrobacter sp. Alg231-14]|uniref:TonB-dependent receptor plug domain-containing protein n=1 Tax=Erythrobacter sp. Alg231-14 TaxID=1922225 RepID=UPI000D55BD4A
MRPNRLTRSMLMQRPLYIPIMGTALGVVCPAMAVASDERVSVQNVASIGSPAGLAAGSTDGTATDTAAMDETGTASTETNTRRTFTPEDFVRFAPRSALDMARQIPGFSIRSGDGARGLGQADTNVIVNGRRISGKSNGPVEALERIPAEEVVRLELVDGASLDIGGLSGQVLNVVTSNSGGITGQFRYAPRFRSKGTPARIFEGSVSFAGGGAKTEWTLALENQSNRRGNEGIERVFDASGALIDTRIEQANFNIDRPNISGSFTRIADNGNVLNATGEVQGFFFRETETSERSGLISLSDRSRKFTRQEDEFSFEFGLDYQFAFGPGQLKLIGLHRFENSPTVSESLTEFSDNSPLEGSVFDRVADEYESIARAEYNVGGLGGNLLFAVEGVRNILDIDSSFEQRDAAGILQPVVLEGATARVDEDRADISVTYSRPLAEGLQFQSSIGGEYSKLSQSGALGQTRTFYRPKGFVSLDWAASETINISGRAERVVGQLDFFDFLSTVDLNQEREDVTNSSLVPQQSWVYEVEATAGLGVLGSLNLRLFYEDITDIVDQIPIEGGGQAPGNLPSAEFYGLSSTLTLLSEGIGWRGTRIDFELDLTDSSVLDPLLGTPRKLSGNTLAEIDFELRHDFVNSVWAIGGSARWEDQAPQVRLDEVAVRTEQFGFIGAFVENKDFAGLTVRASVANLTNRADRFDRTVFVDRAAGIVDFVEDRDRTFGRIFSLTIEGSF